MRNAIYSWLTISLLATPASAHQCLLSPLAIAHNSAAAGKIKVALGDSDNENNPTAWQGPLTISMGSAPACTVSENVSIVEKPLAIGQGILFVPTYSGSSNIIYAIDVKTCRVLWHSDEFIGSVNYADSLLTLGTSHIALNSRCLPKDQ